MKSVRQEFLSVSAALALPLAVIVSFPYSAIRFRAECPPSPPRAHAAFVVLPGEWESRAMRAVKASWQGAAAGYGRIRADLPVGELPEEVAGPVLADPPGSLHTPAAAIPSPLPPLPPSMMAAAPERTPPAAEEPPQRGAFAREELLKIE